MPDVIHVAVGVIVGADGRILVARRPPDVHQGDLWEFPGGKLEPGETVLAALQRELHEELDIVIDPSRCFPLKKIFHRYGDRAVLLDIWRVLEYQGEARGRESQPLAWCEPAQLDPLEFPAANREIIRILQLPELLAITAECRTREEFRENIAGVLAKGIRLIQFRQPELSAALTRQWLADGLQLCRQCNGRLLLNASIELFQESDADGLHVNSALLMGLQQRPVGREVLFSASCHNQEELARAEQLGVDFALLSPVKPTRSHPGSAVLGWQGFQTLASRVSIPVYGLGGLTERDLTSAKSAGAHGIASIRAFRDQSPES